MCLVKDYLGVQGQQSTGARWTTASTNCNEPSVLLFRFQQVLCGYVDFVIDVFVHTMLGIL